MKFITYLLLGLLVVSCKTYSEEDKTKFDQKIEKFVAKSGIPYTRSESGLYYFIEKEGEGANLKFTDEVSFTYVGKLLNGKTFDGKHKRTPLTFEVSKLIEGWKEAFMYLKKGGKAKLIIPPTLGYGDHDLPDIPPHSILVFDIEIKDVK
jgi:FKBP-type peptidyl-prolyl cis-trans isomerase